MIKSYREQLDINFNACIYLYESVEFLTRLSSLLRLIKMGDKNANYAKMKYNSILGGDPVSTGIAKPEGHVEDVANLVKNVTKSIVANNRNFAKSVAMNDSSFAAAAAA